MWPFRAKQAPSTRAEPVFVRYPEAPRVPQPAGMVRQFLGAKVEDLYADLPTAIRAANADIRPAIAILRARARHLEANNDYAAAYLMAGRRNVVGPQGIGLQMKVVQEKPDKKGNTQPDVMANRLIEQAWGRWCKPKVATVDGMSWRKAQLLAWTVLRRDGELLVRLVSGYPGNDFRFAIEFIDVDRLDANLNVARASSSSVAFGGANKEPGNEIRMGVERDGYGKAVAYHILADHPADDMGWTWNGQRYVRIPAAEMIHVYDRKWINAARGVTRFATSIRTMQTMGGYVEAEVVAARIASSKGGFYEETVASDTPQGEGKTARGEPLQEVSPGQFERLPPGVTFKPYDPQHPTSAFDPFIKAMLRGSSAGLGVSYHELSHDLSSANYSSLRQGALGDQDEWRQDQNDLTEEFCQPVFEAWLSMALLTQTVTLPVAKFDKFNAAVWRPRGWAWVDPKSEMAANGDALDRKLTSHRRVCAANGIDFEELLDEIAVDQAMAAAKGIDLTPPTAKTLPIDDATSTNPAGG